MQFLVLLSTVFALLITYLECSTPQAHAPAAYAQTAKVVRYNAEHPVVAVAANPATNSNKPSTPRLPLDLKLPTMESLQQSLDAGRASLMDLFEPREQNRITYNAELVFDREKGEEITGGKVNIRIPLS